MTTGAGSLSTRLLGTTTLVLIAGFAVAIVLLDVVFRRTTETALRRVLEVQVLALLGAAEPDAAGTLLLPDLLPEPRLASPGSGLYAEIRDDAGRVLWRSPSAVGVQLSPGPALAAGERRVVQQALDDGTEVLMLGLGVDWDFGASRSSGFQIFAAEDLAPHREEQARFRWQIGGWFAALALALVVTVGVVLRWRLTPLRRMEGEIGGIETGRRELLGEDYPRELAGVAGSLNALIRAERQRMGRYRATMEDLAHSLKTPLAALRSELEGAAPDGGTMRDQVGRMQAVIDYQLRRAAATGPRTLAAPLVALAPIAREITASLRKIHRERNIECHLDVQDHARYPAEAGDLYELLGNLLDNAWKWAASRIAVRVEQSAPRTGHDAPPLRIEVADDGPGIPDELAERVLARGVRGDERGDVPGQGIGLAVVNELVGLYGGSLTIGRSELGGALIAIRLPGSD